MRKSELLKQNLAQFNRLQEANLTAEKLRQELSHKDAEIALLKQEIDILKSKLNATAPLKNLEERVIHNASLSTDVEYGARAIGKIVVESARCCGEIANNTEGSNNRELINLILGKGEVAKATILEIVAGSLELEEKKRHIDKQCDEALDYFLSVMAQTGQ